jgi:hypothetical protein
MVSELQSIIAKGWRTRQNPFVWGNKIRNLIKSNPQKKIDLSRNLCGNVPHIVFY